MIKLVSILLFTVLLLSVSSATYVKKASAISFTNGQCPKGELRDYMGICFPKDVCKASLFAAHGTCKETADTSIHKTQCTTVNGEQHCTITQSQLSPIPRWNLPTPPPPNFGTNNCEKTAAQCVL